MAKENKILFRPGDKIALPQGRIGRVVSADMFSDYVLVSYDDKPEETMLWEQRYVTLLPQMEDPMFSLEEINGQ